MIEIAGGILLALFALWLLGWMLSDPGSFFGCLFILVIGAVGLIAIVLKMAS